MVKVFVDTNVLIDFMQSSRKGHLVARDCFHLILSGKVEGELSTQSILDAAYICAKDESYNDGAFRDTMSMLTVRINIDPIEPSSVRRALDNSNPDIEDSAQIALAYDNVCDFIITNDAKLLKRELPAPLKAMTPEAFIERCKA